MVSFDVFNLHIFFLHICMGHTLISTLILWYHDVYFICSYFQIFSLSLVCWAARSAAGCRIWTLRLHWRSWTCGNWRRRWCTACCPWAPSSSQPYTPCVDWACSLSAIHSVVYPGPSTRLTRPDSRPNNYSGTKRLSWQGRGWKMSHSSRRMSM